MDYDAFVYFQPQRAYLARALAGGRLPLWDPDLFMGAPFLANPQTAVLYPPSWLFVLGPPEVIYSVQLILHAFLASLFTYLFARHALGTSRPAAAVGGLAYGFGGFVTGQTGHLNQLSAGAWLPAILLTYDRAVGRRSPVWVAVGALALGLQVLAGHPQETYMTGIALVAFGLVRAPWHSVPRLLWAGVAGALLVGLGVLVAAAQLLPTLELTPLSIRGEGVSWEDAVAGSLPTYLAIRALFPPFWLKIASTEYLGYVGVVPLALALLALLVSRSRFVIYGAILCYVGFQLALGENNATYATLFDVVPGFSTFRVPARWLFLWIAGASVLAALGADWIARGARVLLRRPDTMARVVLVAFVVLYGLAWQLDVGEPLPQRRIAVLWLTLSAAALGAGFVATLGRPRLAVGGLVALAAVELWAAADWSPGRQAPPAAIVARARQTADALRATMPPDGRVLSVASAGYVPRDEGALRAEMRGLPDQVVSNGIVATKWREALVPNLPLEFGLRGADGYDGGVLPLARFVQFAGLAIPPDRVRPDGVLESRLDAPPSPQVLDAMGVSHLVAAAGTAPSADYVAEPVGDVAILARRSPPSLASLVFRAEVADAGGAVERLGEPGFDPRATVLLAPGPGVEPSTGSGTGVIESLSAEPERWTARVTASAPGYLLQRDAWYPGWNARVDDQPARLLRADLLFRAVPVPAGTHDVVVAYEPSSMRRGALLSAAGLAGCVALLAWPWWRRRVPIIGRRARP